MLNASFEDKQIAYFLLWFGGDGSFQTPAGFVMSEFSPIFLNSWMVNEKNELYLPPTLLICVDVVVGVGG